MALREKMLVVLSLATISILVLALVMSLVQPFGIISLPFYWGYWILIDLLVYIISIAILLTAGITIGRALEKRVPVGLDNLKASMISTSTGILSATILIFYLIAYLLGAELAYPLIIMALVFAVIPSFISWLLAPAIINIVYRCKPDPKLQEVVNRVALRAGIKPPKAMIVHMDIPNAFAYSSPIMGRYVAVTSGLLKIMNREELEAVIGHELGHHKHRDNVVMMLFGIIPNTIYFLGRSLLFIGMIGRYTDGGERRRSESSSFLLVLLGIALIIVSIALQLLVLSLSRLREYYADAHGAKTTSPYAMINALKALDKFYRYTGAKAIITNSRLRPLFIYAFTDPFIGLEELLATHPPIPKRIAFLESLIGKEIEA